MSDQNDAQFHQAVKLLEERQDKQSWKTAVIILENLFFTVPDVERKRDYAYYLAIAYTRLKEYEKALKYTNSILRAEPNNHQVEALQSNIHKCMKDDGLMGMAIVGTGALMVGTLIGLGIAFARGGKK